ncbi:hypothetical protein SDRG_09833 [Saprolegnia diclina VS20]|uniref:Uncharacterized protein n=1 Tax=Saprolegnia diclina (strain VS20) TaxID=1156394 RepID=T0RR32_SAPDV|nr:hypothetical protein SDRG_09833 [Saprolegnia diclina VS20]EQC32507.1 hypothetical protein SDRG_09833 [Saprolegnia diclina VS20]|eukprot:XP_008614008.1 hypothetical protein SDRG_09833 [Saprolegnia diclina VS20]
MWTSSRASPAAVSCWPTSDVLGRLRIDPPSDRTTLGYAATEAYVACTALTIAPLIADAWVASVDALRRTTQPTKFTSQDDDDETAALTGDAQLDQARLKKVVHTLLHRAASKPFNETTVMIIDSTKTPSRAPTGNLRTSTAETNDQILAMQQQEQRLAHQITDIKVVVEPMVKSDNFDATVSNVMLPMSSQKPSRRHPLAKRSMLYR